MPSTGNKERVFKRDAQDSHSTRFADVPQDATEDSITLYPLARSQPMLSLRTTASITFTLIKLILLDLVCLQLLVFYLENFSVSLLNLSSGIRSPKEGACE